MHDLIIKKIQKLLARADEARNDNPHEREIAMRQAHALLAKHGLAMSDVEGEAQPEDKLGRSFVTLSARATWVQGVWGAVARLNGCEVVRVGTAPTKLAIIGRQLRVEVTTSMARFVVASIERESQSWGRDKVAFGVGAWTGVSKQVNVILRRMQEGIVGEERLSEAKSLVVVSQHNTAACDAKRAVAHFYGETQSRSYSHRGDAQARAAGRKYGERVGLGNQIEGGKRSSLDHLI